MVSGELFVVFCVYAVADYDNLSVQIGVDMVSRADGGDIRPLIEAGRGRCAVGAGDKAGLGAVFALNDGGGFLEGFYLLSLGDVAEDIFPYL